MSGTQHISEEDLTLYAMQALVSEEIAAARLHLESCAACRGTLAEVAGDLAMIGMGVEQQPLPDGARDRFLNLLGRVQQPVPFSSARITPPPVVVSKQRSFLPTLIPWALAAAFALAVAWLGVRDGRLQQQLAGQRYATLQLEAKATRAQRVLDVLTLPGAQRVALTEGKGIAQPIGHATYVPSRGALVFIANNLRPVPQNKTYELWLIPANGHAPIPAGLFRPDSTGSASVVLPQLPTGIDAKAFGVTIEDPQGSSTPTAPIVLSGS